MCGEGDFRSRRNCTLAPSPACLATPIWRRSLCSNRVKMATTLIAFQQLFVRRTATCWRLPRGERTQRPITATSTSCLKRSRDNGRTWGPLQLVQDEPDNPTAKDLDWQSGAGRGPNGSGPSRPYLARLHAKQCADVCHLERRQRQNLVQAARYYLSRRGSHRGAGMPSGPVHGIQLQRGPHAGRLVIPCDHRVRGVDSWGSHLVYSDDHGETWKLGAVDTRRGGRFVASERMCRGRARRWPSVCECPRSKWFGSRPRDASLTAAMAGKRSTRRLRRAKHCFAGRAEFARAVLRRLIAGANATCLFIAGRASPPSVAT